MSTDFQSYNAGYVPGADKAPLISSYQPARITGEATKILLKFLLESARVKFVLTTQAPEIIDLTIT